MDIKSIIEKKRKKAELNKDEILYFVSNYARNELKDSQVGALFSYIYIHGLTEDEMYYFIKAISETGDRISLSEISQDIVDRHSTGGVGDKVSLIIMPILAAMGIPNAKVLSTRYPIDNGLIKKLQIIPGFRTEISSAEFTNELGSTKMSLMSGDFNFAPAESKLYTLRNQISCSDSIPIIAVSLMSMKVAKGGDKLVFDLACGRGTYLENKEEAKRLARLLIRLGARFNKQVKCIIADINEPLGYGFGNVLELKETIEFLNGKMASDLKEVVFKICETMISFNRKIDKKENISDQILEVINNKSAFEKFKGFVQYHNGDTGVIDNIGKLPKASNILPVMSKHAGTIEEIDKDMVGSIARYLGAGRMNDEFDFERVSGIELKAKIGDNVKVGDVLAYIHTNEESKVLGATQNLIDAFKITDKVKNKKVRSIEVVDK